MNRHATAVALLCLQTACATPGTTSVNTPGPRPATEAAAPPTAATGADAAVSMGPAADERDRALLGALRTWFSDTTGSGNGHFFSAFEDLNKDGMPEAVVHVTGLDFCGTGGCTTLVYQWDSKAAAYATVDRSPTTRPPIYVSAREGCQWSMLWLQRSGGGRTTELHSPHPLTGAETCDAPIGQWNEDESKLLIPDYKSIDEGTPF